MSKMADKLIEIEELLVAGFSVDDIVKIADVPESWVIGLELELRGMNQYGYEEDVAYGNY